MIRAEIFLGTGFDRDGRSFELSTKLRLRDLILHHAAGVFGGANWAIGTGIWKPPNREPIMESLAFIVILTEDSREMELEEFAEWVRARCNQESVILTITEVKSRFISRPTHVAQGIYQED